MRPLVSIITPTYNHEKFIGQCIESVLTQTYPNWEQIIIDDGSTDRTAEVISKYRDRRIKYIRQDNVGIWRLSETYNKALQRSQGALIAVLEGDDFWPLWKLERQVPAFDKQEVVLSWGKQAVTNSQGKVIYVSPKSLKRFRNLSREDVIKKLLFQYFIPASTVVCRKEALLSVGGFKQPEYAPYVDYPTWLELSLLGELCPTDEILGYRRLHEGQVSIVYIEEMAKASNKWLIEFFERLPQELKNSLSISASDLLKYRIAWANFNLGRTKLVQGKWGEARKNLRLALGNGTLFIKIVALVGIGCSYLRLNLEWAAVLLRRTRLRKPL